MWKCGVILEEDDDAGENEPEPLFEDLTMDDLQNPSKVEKQLHGLKKRELRERMAKAVSEENYEFAKIYKDELSRREKESKKD
jgi:hypothetical protein